MSPQAGAASRDRGYWGIGIYRPKNSLNIGTLFRSAYAFGASFIFTVGARYTRQAGDTVHADRHIPLLEFANADEMYAGLPKGCPLVGVELHPRASRLTSFAHPERAAYMLGAEDDGIPPQVMGLCHHLIEIPYARVCLNVSVAGSIVMYDRVRARSTP